MSAQEKDEVYDESSYPCGAESLDEDDDKLEEPVDADLAGKLNSDMLCAVCAQILVDPMTLRCGHSFCQICLAQLWWSKSRPHPGVLQCPSCRQPWVHMPGVNIQLRNIVEGSHEYSVSKRRTGLTNDDKQILEEFSKSKTASVVPGTPLQQDVRRAITVLSSLFVGLAVCVAIFAMLIVWVWSGASGEFMRKPVGQWTNIDVVSWVEGLGEWTTPNLTDVFQVQALTGPQLVLLDDKALSQFGIENKFRIQTILQAVEQLKTLHFSTPTNFYQFKAAHRRTTLLFAVFFSTWPRFTFLYCYLFEYYTVFLPVAKTQFFSSYTEVPADGLHAEGPADGLHAEVPADGLHAEVPADGLHAEVSADGLHAEVPADGFHAEGPADGLHAEVPADGLHAEGPADEVNTDNSTDKMELSWKQLCVFCVEVFLFPYVVVSVVSVWWLWVHPSVCVPIIAHCGVAMVQEALSLYRTPPLHRPLLSAGVSNLVKFSLSVTVFLVLWPIVPHFICDLVLYIALWNTLLARLILTPINYVVRKRNAHRMAH